MDTLETVKSLYQSFADGNLPAVVSAMSGSIEWSEAEGNPYAPDGAPFVGPDEVVQRLFGRLATEWSEFAVHPATYHHAGDVIVVEGRYTGRHLGTEVDLDAQFCHIWTAGDDALVRFQQYTDTAQLRDAMDSG